MAKAFSIKGAPETVSELFSNGETMVTWNPFTMLISLWRNGTVFGQMDCSSYSNWDGIVKEFERRFGFTVRS